jgi:hypothetical protein
MSRLFKTLLVRAPVADSKIMGSCPQITDILGYAASFAVLATFTVRNMLPCSPRAAAY